MHHPFHIHGAGRFLVLARDGEPDDNLVWKDTVLVRSGETVDILLDVTNPGLWMAHCHIAEHNQAGMMFSFRGDRGRRAMNAAANLTPSSCAGSDPSVRRRSSHAVRPRRESSLAHLGRAVRELADHRHRQHHRERHAPSLVRQLGAEREPAAVGRRRLHGCVRRPAPARRHARRPMGSPTLADHRAGRVRGRVGRRRVRPAGSASWSPHGRSWARAAAFIMPATLSILTNTFTDARERAMAIGIWSGVIGIGVVLGPLAGGLPPRPLLVGIGVHRQRADRRRSRSSPPASWCPSRATRTRHASTGSAALFRSSGSSSLVTAIIEAPNHGWTSVPVLGLVRRLRRRRWRPSPSGRATSSIRCST